MSDNEKDFQERLKREQEERAYQEWKKTNDPEEIKKTEKEANSLKPTNVPLFFLYLAIFVFGIWFSFFRS
jgi:hypothetical protein